MPTATVTSKGQITIPIEVREAMRIRTGSRIQFLPRDDGTWDFIPLNGSVKDIAGSIAWDGPPVTLEEMDAGIAEAVAEKYRSL
ncbi:MAG: AbrB/MazE/SpoVT family DNA-binding domain-containing protein [Rhodoglobus sp.]|nr:AbrB/MazE/SpoVT family DNA-binding domain-containing protein [Rhodoglobus sp.]